MRGRFARKRWLPEAAYGPAIDCRLAKGGQEISDGRRGGRRLRLSPACSLDQPVSVTLFVPQTGVAARANRRKVGDFAVPDGVPSSTPPIFEWAVSSAGRAGDS